MGPRSRTIYDSPGSGFYLDLFLTMRAMTIAKSAPPMMMTSSAINHPGVPPSSGCVGTAVGATAGACVVDAAGPSRAWLPAGPAPAGRPGRR